MKRTFEIFVGSTYKDLKKVRQIVCDNLQRISIFTTINMENFGANPSKPVAYCLEMVKKSDFYVGIFTRNRGFEIEEPTGEFVSITELEYDKAVISNIPVFISTYLTNQNDDQRMAQTAQQAERQNVFLERILKDHIVITELDDPQKLATELITSIINYLLEVKILRSDTGQPEKLNYVQDKIRLQSSISDLTFLTFGEKESLILQRQSTIRDAIIRSIRDHEANGSVSEATARRLTADLLYHVDKAESLRRYEILANQGEAGPFEYNRIGQLRSILSPSDAALAAYDIALSLSPPDMRTKYTIRLNRISTLIEHDRDMAKDEIDNILERSEELGKYSLLGWALTSKALLLLNDDEHELSMEYSVRALNEELIAGNLIGAAHDANNIVTAMLHCGETGAEEAIERAIELNTDALRASGLGIAFFNRARWRRKALRDNSGWLEDIQMSQGYLLEANDIRRLSATYRFMAHELIDEDEGKAAWLFEKSAVVLKRVGRSREVIEDLFLAAVYYYKSGDRKSGMRVTERVLAALSDKQLWVQPEWPFVLMLIQSMSLSGGGSAFKRRNVLRRVADAAQKSGSRLYGEELAIISAEYLKERKFLAALKIDREIDECAEFRTKATYWEWLGNFGATLSGNGLCVEAYRRLREANAAYLLDNNRRSLANNYTNLTETCLKLHKFGEGRMYHDLAVQLERDLGNRVLTFEDAKHEKLLRAIEGIDPRFRAALIDQLKHDDANE